MASIGGVRVDKAAKHARAARFAADAAAGVPEAPERRFAHPDFARDKITRTDPAEKLVSLCRRKLAAGEALSPVQLAALAAAGVNAGALAAEAAASAPPPLPEIYGGGGGGHKKHHHQHQHQHGHKAKAAGGGSNSSSATAAAAAASAAVRAAAAAPASTSKRPRALSSSSSAGAPAAASATAPHHGADGGSDDDDEGPTATGVPKVDLADPRAVSLRLRRLRKRLKRIDDAVARGGPLSDAWARRVACRPAVLAELGALEAVAAPASSTGGK